MNINIEKEYIDQSIETYKASLVLYFKKTKDISTYSFYKCKDDFEFVPDITRDGIILCTEKYFNNTETIVLKGDNLITIRNILKKLGQCFYREYEKDLMEIWENDKLDNDQHIYSFYLLPFVKYLPTKNQLNSRRASCKDYMDSPFAFFSSLEEMYKSDFQVDCEQDQDCDSVKAWINKTKTYWEIFGEGIDGFKNHLESFCIDYDFLIKCEGYERKKWNEYNWMKYFKDLVQLKHNRKTEIKKRILYTKK